MIAWFTKHPTGANLLMLGLVILGLATVGSLQRETFPQIERDEVEVRLVYPGATPGEVEDVLCRRVEDALEGVVDMDELRCEAQEGRAVVIATMHEGASLGAFRSEIESAVDGIDDFPDDVEAPTISELGQTERVVSVAVVGPEDPLALKAYAEGLKDRMQRMASVSEVTIDGFSDAQLRVEVSSLQLRQYGLSIVDIAQAIERRNVGVPVGRLEGGREEILLRVDDQRQGVRALRDLVILSGDTGAAIRLGEIATVTDQFEDDASKLVFDGRRAALLTVYKTRSQDALTVYKSVSDFVESEQDAAPPGVALTVTWNTASIVGDRLGMLTKNGLQGLLLVFAVLWLFFGARYGFWVAAGLPVSFLGGLFVLGALGVTINMISMVGLLIGIGLLMDDAIVISENIAAKRARGLAPVQAAIQGTQQVLPGIMSSFTTTLLVFGSLALITGELGQILRVMPVVLIVVLTVSLLEAFLILPNHLAHAMTATEKVPRWRQRFESGFSAVRDRGFGPLVDAAVDYRYLTLGLVVMAVLLALAIPAGGHVKFQAFPELDGDVAEARILLPQGTPLPRTEAVVAEVEAALGRVNDDFAPRQPKGQDLVRHVMVMYGQNPDAGETGPHVVRVVADLLSAEDRNASLDDFFAAWRKETGQPSDVVWINFTEPAMGPAGKAIDLRLVGSDLDRLKSAGTEVVNWLNQFAGVADLSDDLRPGKREYRIRLKPTAGSLGIDAQMVADQLRGAFQGVVVDEFARGAEHYEVDLRLAAGERTAPGDLLDAVIVTSAGEAVPLRLVADIEVGRGWARILRVNGERTVTLQGTVDPRLANAAELIGALQAQLLPTLQERYPGIRLVVEGQSAAARETTGSLLGNVAVGLMGVYLLLALQLRGYMLPLAVMAVIPTAGVGALVGHSLIGHDLSLPSLVGLASLFGVVVNDSILLTFFIRDAHATSGNLIQAAKEAARARFRPIMLTSITTVAGLLPLLLETSLQAQVLIPLAISIAFGLATATIAALFIVPAVYCVLGDLGYVQRSDAGDAGPQVATV